MSTLTNTMLASLFTIIVPLSGCARARIPRTASMLSSLPLLNRPVPKEREIYLTPHGLWYIRKHEVQWVVGLDSQRSPLPNATIEDACLGVNGSLLVLTDHGLFRFSREANEVAQTLLLGFDQSGGNIGDGFLSIIGEVHGGVWLWGLNALFEVSSGRVVRRLSKEQVFAPYSKELDAPLGMKYPHLFFSDRIGDTLYCAFSVAANDVRYAVLSLRDGTWHLSAEKSSQPYPIVWWNNRVYCLGDNIVLASVTRFIKAPTESSAAVASIRNLYIDLGEGKFFGPRISRSCRTTQIVLCDLAAIRSHKMRIPGIESGGNTTCAGVIQMAADNTRLYFWQSGMHCDDVGTIVRSPCE